MSNKTWIEKRKNVVLMVRIFLAVSIVLLLLDLWPLGRLRRAAATQAP